MVGNNLFQERMSMSRIFLEQIQMAARTHSRRLAWKDQAGNPADPRNFCLSPRFSDGYPPVRRENQVGIDNSLEPNRDVRSHRYERTRHFSLPYPTLPLY